MIINIAKGSDRDWLRITRADGDVTETSFPKKGTIPHDAVHFFAERTLGFSRGFWGMVADGIDPEAIQSIAKEAGHASAKRAEQPDAQIIQLLQSERLVECLEACLWGDEFNPETMRDTYEAACRSSLVPVPELDDRTIGEMGDELQAFAAKWHAIPTGGAVELEWEQEREHT